MEPTYGIAEIFTDYYKSASKRLAKLDELYTQIEIVSGFDAEQLLEMFMAGYTMQPPNKSEVE